MYQYKNLKNLLDSLFTKNSLFQKFKSKFPKIYLYSQQVKIIPWSDNFAIADKNPEIIDQIERLKSLYEKNLITKEKYLAELEKCKTYASKTLAVSFIENNEVSFRETPTLQTVLHELGHCYFKEPDIYWSRVYGGGESIMYSILYDYLEGSEKEIKKYMYLLKLIDYDYEFVYQKLNEATKEVSKRFSLDLEDIIDLLIFTGAIPIISDHEGLNKKLGNIKPCSVKVNSSDVYLILVDLFSPGRGYQSLMNFLFKTLMDKINIPD